MLSGRQRTTTGTNLGKRAARKSGTAVDDKGDNRRMLLRFWPFGRTPKDPRTDYLHKMDAIAGQIRWAIEGIGSGSAGWKIHGFLLALERAPRRLSGLDPPPELDPLHAAWIEAAEGTAEFATTVSSWLAGTDRPGSVGDAREFLDAQLAPVAPRLQRAINLLREAADRG